MDLGGVKKPVKVNIAMAGGSCYDLTLSLAGADVGALLLCPEAKDVAPLPTADGKKKKDSAPPGMVIYQKALPESVTKSGADTIKIRAKTLDAMHALGHLLLVD